MLTDIYLALGAYAMEYACSKTILDELGYMLYLNGDYTESILISHANYIQTINSLYLANNLNDINTTIQIFLDNDYDLLEVILYFYNKKDYGKMFEFACKSKNSTHKIYIGVYYLMYDLHVLAKEYIFDSRLTHNISFKFKMDYYSKTWDSENLIDLIYNGITVNDQDAIDRFISGKLEAFPDSDVILYYTLFTTISDKYFYRYNYKFMDIFTDREMNITDMVEKTIEMEDGKALLIYSEYLYSKRNSEFFRYAKMSLDYGNLDSTVLVGTWYAIKRDYDTAIAYFRKGIKWTDMQCAYVSLSYAYKSTNNFEEWTYTVIEYYEKYNDEYLPANNVEMDTELKTFYLLPFYKATTKVFECFECPIELKECMIGYRLACGHIYSKQIFMIRDNACPLCRRAICE